MEEVVEGVVRIVGVGQLGGVLLSAHGGVQFVAVAQQSHGVACLADIAYALNGCGVEAQKHGVPGIGYLLVGGLGDVAYLAYLTDEVGCCYFAIAVEAEDSARGMAVGYHALQMGHAQFLELCHGSAGIYTVEDVAEVEDLEFAVGDYG